MNNEEKTIRGKYIGLSLSFCVRDILNGNVKLSEVLYIISGTKIETEEQWNKVISDYKKIYWRGFQEIQINFILNYLKKRIIQPRNLNGDDFCHSIAKGIWAKIED